MPPTGVRPSGSIGFALQTDPSPRWPTVLRRLVEPPASRLNPQSLYTVHHEINSKTHHASSLHLHPRAATAAARDAARRVRLPRRALRVESESRAASAAASAPPAAAAAAAAPPPEREAHLPDAARRVRRSRRARQAQSQSRAAPAAASAPAAAAPLPPAATETGSAGAEALAELRAAPRTPRCGPSYEHTVRQRRAASPAASRESSAAGCAQQPPRQRRAAATSALTDNCHWRL